MSDTKPTAPRETNRDGLHCVYGKCRGIPHSDRPCNPGCYVQGSALSDIERLRRTLGIPELPDVAGTDTVHPASQTTLLLPRLMKHSSLTEAQAVGVCGNLVPETMKPV